MPPILSIPEKGFYRNEDLFQFYYMLYGMDVFRREIKKKFVLFTYKTTK